MNHVIRAFRPCMIGCAFLLWTSSNAGCATHSGRPAPRFAADFQRAEAWQEQTGKPLLLVFLDSRAARDKAMKACLKDAELKTRLAEALECRLFRANEADRRYVAQYHVERAPALVLVHADGTYHAFTEAPTPEAVRRFLDESRAPGANPTFNPLIARAPRYRWANDLETALKKAAESRRDALLVLYRNTTRDWSRISSMLDRAEVFRRFDGMVHARITGWVGRPTEAMDRFEITTLPALVIVRADGSVDRLELPISSEAIIRFADAARSRTAPAPPGSMTSVTP